ncbi:MAG: IS4 family transposase [Nitrospiraceae bacterium]
MKSVENLLRTTFSGRRFTRKQLAQVQETVERFPKLSRTELARTVCEHLNWKTPNGKDKVESCLTLLEKLEAQGVVSLPAKQVRQKPQRRVPRFENDPPETPIEAALSTLRPIQLEAVSSSGQDRERWKAYLQTYHYLGYRQPVGPHLGYFIVSQPRQHRLGCLLFSASAAWALAPRDRWIGWDDQHRKKLLHLVLSNDRFLIFPWVHVPNLASHALSLATPQIGEDWVRAFGYRPVLIETFVDPTAFAGTCYRAANWQFLGHTQGRGRLAPDHQCHTSKKEIFVYPLQSDWQQQLTSTARAVALKKRYRNDLQASQTPSIDDSFVSLWEKVAHIFHDVAAHYDRKWRLRKRVIDTLMLMLLIFRLVSSKNTQSYGTTIDDLWDNCEKLKLALPQKNSIAPSSFCAARQKLDEAVFKCANQNILVAYAADASRYWWLGHRLFAVDGSKINLPRELLACGYSTPAKTAHYPQGLLSCLYQLKSQLPFDFELASHANERLSAVRHLEVLQTDDVVVYDRGYFSYVLLHRHAETGIHAIFRLQENSSSAIKAFFASPQTDTEITLLPSLQKQAEIRSQYPDLDIVPLKLRLLKYKIADTLFCLGTTLLDVHRYPLQEFIDVYHSRWGIEELYKVSKRIFIIEDFHGKTERGVKQEIFAHFVLVTLNRLFANRADIELNSGQPSTSQSPGLALPDLKTNFKNCIHVLERGFEELFLLHERIRGVVQRLFRTIVARYHRVRPNRSFIRRSMRPDTKWHPSKEKRQAQKAQKATAPA